MCFIVCILRRTNHCHHCCLTVPSKWVLKNPCQLAVPIGDMTSTFWVRLFLCQSWNDISKCWQWLINLLTFFKTFTSCSSYVNSFTTCKIDKIKFSYFYLFPSCTHLLDNYYKNGMWARADIIHSSACLNTCLLASKHQIIDFCRRPDSPFRKSFNENSSFWFRIFSNKKWSALSFKKIWNSFIVDLEVASSYHKLGVIRHIRLNVSKNFFHTARDDSSRWICLRLKSFHRKRLSCPCLSISKDGSIISFENWHNCWLRCCTVDNVLSATDTIDIVKSKMVLVWNIGVLLHIRHLLLFIDCHPQVFRQDQLLTNLIPTSVRYLNNRAKWGPICKHLSW